MQNPLAKQPDTTKILTVSTWKPPETTGHLEQSKPASNPQHLHQVPTAPNLPKEVFQYKGREWRIYKRGTVKNSSWYFQIEKDSRRYPTSLRTSAVAAAVAQAKLLIDAADQRKLDQVRGILSNRPEARRLFATVDQYLIQYESTPTGENTLQSRHAAVLAFRRLYNAMENPPPRMDARLELLFKAARERANRAAENAAGNTEKMTIKRSFNSTLASAASVFSELAVFHLKDKLVLPDFTDLRVLVKFLRFNDAKKTAAQYNPPQKTVLDATLAEWAELPRNEFLAVGLALCCGMRRGEIRDFADWSWFERHGGQLWCNARTGDFKDRTDVLRCQALEPFYSMLMARVQTAGWSQTGRVIQGNRSDFDRNVSAWMVRLGWQTRLHLHALRAWAGSLVYMRYGVREASAFCRHADEKTTKEHYGWLRTDFHTADQPVLIAGKPVEWAK